MRPLHNSTFMDSYRQLSHQKSSNTLSILWFLISQVARINRIKADDAEVSR